MRILFLREMIVRSESIVWRSYSVMVGGEGHRSSDCQCGGRGLEPCNSFSRRRLQDRHLDRR